MSQQRDSNTNTPLRRAEARGFFLTAVTLATTTWGIAFNLGAYQTVFFRHLFAVWVIVTTIFLAALVIPKEESALPWWGRIVLSVPSLAMALAFGDRFVPAEFPLMPPILVTLSSIAVLVCLPYAVFVVVSITNPNVLELRRLRLRAALIGILLAAFLAGYLVGVNNAYFLTCGDFTISGEDTPVNCRPGPPTRF